MNFQIHFLQTTQDAVQDILHLLALFQCETQENHNTDGRLIGKSNHHSLQHQLAVNPSVIVYQPDDHRSSLQHQSDLTGYLQVEFIPPERNGSTHCFLTNILLFLKPVLLELIF